MGSTQQRGDPAPVACGLSMFLHHLQGQEWTTIEGLIEEGHHNKIQEIEPGGHGRVSMQEGSGANVLLDDGLFSAAGWLQLHAGCCAHILQ